jgi:hypothetical protein
MMNKIPLLEKFAAQSLVYVDTGLSDGKELVFSKEKFAELIVRQCAQVGERYADGNYEVFNQILEHFGLEEE